MLSPQSQKVYQTLLGANEALSAEELARKLRIVPQSVYRLTEPLTGLGLISKTDEYPTRFIAKPVNEAASLFLLAQNDWFVKKFGKIPSASDLNPPVGGGQTPINFSFVQSRDELMRLSAEEINKAAKSIDLLRSGREMPADVMLAHVEAKSRGVITRMLIQDYSPGNAQLVEYWKQNGILVRKTPLRHIRLMIYDASIVYFMSYTHADPTKDLGVKIAYPPFAAILSQLFDGWWRGAERP